MTNNSYSTSSSAPKDPLKLDEPKVALSNTAPTKLLSGLPFPFPFPPITGVLDIPPIVFPPALSLSLSLFSLLLLAALSCSLLTAGDIKSCFILGSSSISSNIKAPAPLVCKVGPTPPLKSLSLSNKGHCFSSFNTECFIPYVKYIEAPTSNHYYYYSQETIPFEGSNHITLCIAFFVLFRGARQRKKRGSKRGVSHQFMKTPTAGKTGQRGTIKTFWGIKASTV